MDQEHYRIFRLISAAFYTRGSGEEMKRIFLKMFESSNGDMMFIFTSVWERSGEEIDETAIIFPAPTQ